LHTHIFGKSSDIIQISLLDLNTYTGMLGKYNQSHKFTVGSFINSAIKWNKNVGDTWAYVATASTLY
jgi:hypothetical protein